MPVIDLTYGGPGAPLGGWPIAFSYTTPAPPLPPLPQLPDLGLGPFDFGVNATFICPGQTLCKKKGVACMWQALKAGRVDPADYIAIKLPQIPQLPAFPTWTFALSIPPGTFQPLKCPNLPGKH